jgi:hypothetical protein
MTPYERGYRAALRKMLKHHSDMLLQNMEFFGKFPRAPRYQRTTSKYAINFHAASMDWIGAEVGRRKAKGRKP